MRICTEECTVGGCNCLRASCRLPDGTLYESKRCGWRYGTDPVDAINEVVLKATEKGATVDEEQLASLIAYYARSARCHALIVKGESARFFATGDEAWEALKSLPAEIGVRAFVSGVAGGGPLAVRDAYGHHVPKDKWPEEWK